MTTDNNAGQDLLGIEKKAFHHSTVYFYCKSLFANPSYYLTIPSWHII